MRLEKGGRLFSSLSQIIVLSVLGAILLPCNEWPDYFISLFKSFCYRFPNRPKRPYPQRHPSVVHPMKKSNYGHCMFKSWTLYPEWHKKWLRGGYAEFRSDNETAMEVIEREEVFWMWGEAAGGVNKRGSFRGYLFTLTRFIARLFLSPTFLNDGLRRWIESVLLFKSSLLG